MKHLIKTALYLLALIIPATSLAHDFEVNGIYYNINGTTATVTYKGTSSYQYQDRYSGSVTIPATVTYSGTTYPVTSIGYGAFMDCKGLMNLTIPNSVTNIGDGAFHGCTSLTTINIPNSVIAIGNSAFSDCSSLTAINIPNSVTEISYRAFYNCSSLTSINIPNLVTVIGYNAFEDCSNLTNINIPNSVATIGYNAFKGTAWFDNQPDGLIYAGLIAYKYKGTMPEGTTITLKNGTKGITDCAFDDCSGLTCIEIPNSITSIGNFAFSSCSSLNNINIPNSVISIGYWAFSYCSCLSSITIGNSVTSIGDAAFYNCSSLNNVFCFSDIPPECTMIEYDFFQNYSATLHVPAASLAAYFTAPVWSNFENIVGDAIEPTGISISRDSIEIPLGEQIELTATVTPANASCKEVAWYSTDTSVATVENGVVTAVGYGECDIYAYCMGMPAICHVSVTNRISLEQQEAMLLPNHMLVLNPTAPAMPAGFTVTSSDPTVAAARVMNGKVQIVGIKEGTTTITVASSDGTAQPATCLVTVYTELGDANCDGFLNISDLTLLIDYLMNNETTTIKETNADLNSDGNINIADVTALIDHLLTTTD